jgi:hypothetical protein
VLSLVHEYVAPEVELIKFVADNTIPLQTVLFDGATIVGLSVIVIINGNVLVTLDRLF